MAKVYSTPGVYIEEKSAFPNSVVAVATAVPAFIGYTEKAIHNKRNVTNEPVRISSFGEYLMYFGGAPNTTYEIAQSNEGAGFKLSPKEEHFLLFNSMKLFYANGGADCYIVSIGNYQDTVKADDFFGDTPDQKKKGVDALLKYMEPTILVAPDLMLLDPSQAASVQAYMLKHCGTDTKSRIAILDVPNGDKERTDDGESVITTFRKGVGNNLDFGAAYYPWLHTTITSNTEVSFENIDVDNLDNLQNILNLDIQASLNAGLINNQTRADNIRGEVDKIGHFKPYLILEKMNAILRGLSVSEISRLNHVDASSLAGTAKSDALKSVEQIVNDAKAAVTELKTLESKMAPLLSAGTTSPPSPASSPPTSPPSAAPALSEVEINLQAVSKNFGAFKTTLAAFEAKTNGENFTGIETDYNALLSSLDSSIKLKPVTKTLHQALLVVHPLYKSIIDSIAESINLLPPSAAMAGIYTMVDNNIGVYQSPANVSLGSVVKPAVNISGNEQDDLNVPLNGKAVNAIRSFPGKGILVWGARTLDGNSLDWRYISVRRTVIMIEQSVKNAAEAYVFEPNVASTWANMKAMLNNFLTNVWASGALAGATPEDAFSIDVGLGVTMTPVDILEGIMRVSIKLAVTRPAEFIIITFEQQMQKS
jgi:phage tail sheath protein FI